MAGATEAGCTTPTYLVIEANTSEESQRGELAGDHLIRQVTAAMADGWRPTGGLAVQVIGGEVCYWQAMIRPAGWKRPEECQTLDEIVGEVKAQNGRDGHSAVAREQFHQDEDGTIQPTLGRDKPVEAADEKRLIQWLDGLKKEHPGWMAEWSYKSVVGMKPRARIILKTTFFAREWSGYWMMLTGTARILFPWVELTVESQPQPDKK